jgi:hypothetical protein
MMKPASEFPDDQPIAMLKRKKSAISEKKT